MAAKMSLLSVFRRWAERPLGGVGQSILNNAFDSGGLVCTEDAIDWSEVAFCGGGDTI